MTILFTLDNPERTGAPIMALHYARALVDRGHRVVAACGPETIGISSILSELGEAGIDVHKLPAVVPANIPTILRRLRTVIRDEHVRCVIGFQQRDRPVACLAARLTQTPCVISAQNQHVFRGKRAERWMKEWVYGRSLRGSAALVVCTSEVVEREIRGRFGVPVARTRVLPNGIDVTAFPTFAPEEIRRTRRELGLSADERLLLNVGRMDRQKGQDLLVEAFRAVAELHPRARLGLVGAPGRSSASADALRYHDRLRAMVKECSLEDRVLFLGWRDDVPRLLAATDLYVQPSRWEGWPVAVVEAMAAGVSVVATDCSGRPRGFVDGAHGWIVATGDVAALRDGLARCLAASDEELRTMGAAARSVVARYYDIRQLGPRFVELVEEVAA